MNISYFKLKRIISVGVSLLGILTILIVSGSCAPKGYSGPIESVTVTYASYESNGLLFIADEEHFFAQNGLNIKMHPFEIGPVALQELSRGQSDIAIGIAEFPIVESAFQKSNIQALATIDKADIYFLVGRKDRGIQIPADLAGKRIKTTKGTAVDFYMRRFLEINGVNTENVTFVDIQTSKEAMAAILNGDVDAASEIQPNVNATVSQLGSNAVSWREQSGQLAYGLTVAQKDWIAKNPETVRRFLLALKQAEDYLTRNPAQAKAIVQKRLNLDAGYMETVWSQNQFGLSLDQSLVAAMEDEARWMISSNLTTEKQIPNFNDDIYEDALKAVTPEVVNIIR